MATTASLRAGILGPPPPRRKKTHTRTRVPCRPGATTTADCTDTSNGATDADEYGCDVYSATPDECTRSGIDDADFTPLEMCCGCGGGELIQPVAPIVSPPQPLRLGARVSSPALRQPGRNVLADGGLDSTGSVRKTAHSCSAVQSTSQDQWI